jgi:hypothetical protein
MVHEQSKHEFSQWLDTNSNNQIERYKLSIVDSCGKETEISSNHTTILLSSNLGTNGTVNLTWNAYEGFPYQNFEIWRSTDGNNFSLLSNVANNSYAYIDNNPSANAYYQVRIQNSTQCNPSKRGTNMVISNTVDKTGKSVASVNTLSENNIAIYPNPSEKYITITNLRPNQSISIIDINGRKIYESEVINNKMEIQLDQFAQKGIYFIQVKQDNLILNSSKIILH